MRLVTRLWIRRELKKARRAGDVERQDLLELVIQEPDVEALVDVASQAEYEYERDLNRQKLEGPRTFGSPFADFFKWLIENREKIFEFIMTIVSLFAMMDNAPEDPEEKERWAASNADRVLLNKLGSDLPKASDLPSGNLEGEL